MTTLFLLVGIMIVYAIGLAVVCKFYPEILKNDSNDPPLPPGY
jgi:hypothetical protein